MSLYNVLLILAAAVCLFSLVSSFYFMRKQEHKELDKDISGTTVRHPVAANPMVIGYWLFPILVVLGAIVLAMFTR
ncbi:hypothetical protein [Cohnella fermenti]|uniref:Short-chain dehydrogenase n=1 Tax=Cohnella fermenti TaxID=2565925 RepID=A0A4S4BLU7_9BACL|nr:hypothetical protein [Cohnella fermenti]THF75743.1 hypothetical protein E6C55_21050 [Cohnella fermenti]